MSRFALPVALKVEFPDSKQLSPLLYSYATLPIRETSQAEGYQQTSSEASRENIAPLRRSLPV